MGENKFRLTFILLPCCQPSRSVSSSKFCQLLLGVWATGNFWIAGTVSKKQNPAHVNRVR